MQCRMVELRRREVINIRDGCRLGFVGDVEVLLPEGTDPHTALGNLRQLEEEDPQLHIAWNEQTRQIHVQLMG